MCVWNAGRLLALAERLLARLLRQRNEPDGQARSRESFSTRDEVGLTQVQNSCVLNWSGSVFQMVRSLVCWWHSSCTAKEAEAASAVW